LSDQPRLSQLVAGRTRENPWLIPAVGTRDSRGRDAGAGGPTLFSNGGQHTCVV
jgi:hypothetical protein